MKIKSIFACCSFAVVLLVFCAFTKIKKDDCASEGMTSTAVDQLKKFTMVQDYPFYFKKKKKSDPIEYKKFAITMSRGVRYKFFTVKNPEFDGIPVVSIYSSDKQDVIIGSTYNINLKKYYNELEFECKASGNYCLAFSFQDGLEGCGLGIFSSLIKN